MKEQLAEIISQIQLRTEEREGTGYHGSSKGDTIKYNVYWDELRGEWNPSKDIVMQNAIIFKLRPIIHEILSKEKSEL